MCGRFIQTREALKAARALGIHIAHVDNIADRFNAAPSQELWVARRNHQTGEASLDPLRWGLIPSFVSEANGGPRPINAKAETIATSAFFRNAFRRRRCLVPADGYYEWYQEAGAKQAVAISSSDGPIMLAGIWDNWQQPDAQWLRTFAIVTRPAIDSLARYHHRMPLILRPDAWARWMSDEPDPRDLLQAQPPDDMQAWNVSFPASRDDKPAFNFALPRGGDA